MKALVLSEIGSIENLRLEEREAPQPDEKEVRVALQSAALNHRDVFLCQGLYPGIQLPAILGSDGAGIIDRVGRQVSDDLSGQEVIIYPASDWGDNPRAPSANYRVLGMPADGTFADYICVSADHVYPKPAHLSWHQAAALPLAGLTAWRAVVTQARVQAGESVLITGAGGGVATFALKWAVKLGAQVYVTSGSEEKLARAKTMGAQEGVNYRDEDWHKQLLALCGGVDVVIDGTGGNGLVKCFEALKPGGTIVFYGSTAGDPDRFISMPRWFFKQANIQGTTMGSNREFAEMIDFVNKHRIEPAIDSVYSLQESAKALAHMASGAQQGKLVFDIA